MKDLITKSGSLSSSMIQTCSLNSQQNDVDEIFDSLNTNLNHFKRTLMKMSPYSITETSGVDAEEIRRTSEMLMSTGLSVCLTAETGVGLDDAVKTFFSLIGDLMSSSKLVALTAEKGEKLEILNETQNLLSTSQALLNEAVKSESDPQELKNLVANLDVALNLINEDFKDVVTDEHYDEIFDLKSQFNDFMIDPIPRTEAERINQLMDFSRRIVNAANRIAQTESDSSMKVKRKILVSFVSKFLFLIELDTEQHRETELQPGKSYADRQ